MIGGVVLLVILTTIVLNPKAWYRDGRWSLEWGWGSRAIHAVDRGANPYPRSEVEMRTVFVSFSALYGLLLTGVVKESDLDDGIFFFGTSPGRVLGDPSPIEVVRADRMRYIDFDGPWCEWLRSASADLDETYRLIGVLRAAVDKATADGRLAWWDRDRWTCWQQLIALLERNGVECPELKSQYVVHDYTYWQVEDLLQGRARVMWGGSRKI